MQCRPGERREQQNYSFVSLDYCYMIFGLGCRFCLLFVHLSPRVNKQTLFGIAFYLLRMKIEVPENKLCSTVTRRKDSLSAFNTIYFAARATGAACILNFH